MSGAQHGTAEGVAPLVEAIHEALVAEAHGLLRGLASRLGEVLPAPRNCYNRHNLRKPRICVLWPS